MCAPAALAAIPAALNIGGTILDAVGKAQQAQENEKSARDAFSLQSRLLTLRQLQEQQAGAQTILQADRQARQQDALARVGAGEAGVTGASVDALLSGIERDRSAFSEGTTRNTQLAVDQLEYERQSAEAAMNGRINGTQAPSPWLAGLRIAGAAASFGSDVYSNLPLDPAQPNAAALSAVPDAPGAAVPASTGVSPVFSPSVAAFPTRSVESNVLDRAQRNLPRLRVPTFDWSK